MDDRHSRQSFLGKYSEEQIRCCKIGVVGLGGGGSHIVQQLAHIGFLNYVLYDSQEIEPSNLNRLIGGTYSDAIASASKLEIAKRSILGLQPTAIIEGYKTRWQDNPLPLRNCDIIFGCVDGFDERRQLETSARRYLIPYIDIGLDVHPGTPPSMTGQVILSLPGRPCLKCLGFLSDRNLAKEAAMYGAAGIRPQVVWANGVLASLAVGIGVDLVTGWAKSSSKIIYLSFDGNFGTVKQHVRVEHMTNDECLHFPLQEAGEPIFRRL